MMQTTPLLAAALVALAVLVWPGVARAQDRPRGWPAPRGRDRGAAHGGGGEAARADEGVTAPRLTPLRRLAHRARDWWSGGGVGVVEEVQLLDGLAAALEAGLPTEQAVRLALDPVTSAGREADPWPELARAAGEGQPLGPAWQRLARRTGSGTAASVARAWAVAAVTGAPVAAAVRSSAHAARERRRLERAVEVATAGARATATVLGLLPLAGVGLAALLGVHPVTLYAHPLAMASAGLGLVLLLLGHLTVRRMVKHVLRDVS